MRQKRLLEIKGKRYSALIKKIIKKVVPVFFGNTNKARR